MKYSALMIGAGGWADVWIRSLLPPFGDRIEIAAVVDTNAEVLAAQQSLLGLPADRAYQSIQDAIAALRGGDFTADCSLVVTPPGTHREAIEECLTAGLDVLCEKPLAASWQDCLAIHTAVAGSTQRVAVMQNYRHHPAVRTARDLVAQRVVGDPYLVTARFRADYRAFGSWAGPTRHQMARPILEDAAVHHLDQIRHLTGLNFKQIACDEWKPSAAQGFAGACCVNLLARMENGVRATYEANVVCASDQRSWTGEEYRIECVSGAVVVHGDQLSIERHTTSGLSTEPIPLAAEPRVLHPAAIEEFLDWLDGGPAPETQVHDNINSVAAVIAALESADTGLWADVPTVNASAS